jgi:transposase
VNIELVSFNTRSVFEFGTVEEVVQHFSAFLRPVLLNTENEHVSAIATRYDKTARNFLAAIHLAATVILLN